LVTPLTPGTRLRTSRSTTFFRSRVERATDAGALHPNPHHTLVDADQLDVPAVLHQDQAGLVYGRSHFGLVDGAFHRPVGALPGRHGLRAVDAQGELGVEGLDGVELVLGVDMVGIAAQKPLQAPLELAGRHFEPRGPLIGPVGCATGSAAHVAGRRRRHPG
jgi:hypothetical protein